MAKVYVQIRDKGSVFYDGLTKTSVSGLEPVLIEKTDKVTKAIKGGALKQLDEKEAKTILASLETPQTDDTQQGDDAFAEYGKHTVAELKDILKEKGIEFDDNLKKAELIALLVDADTQE